MDTEGNMIGANIYGYGLFYWNRIGELRGWFTRHEIECKVRIPTAAILEIREHLPKRVFAVFRADLT